MTNITTIKEQVEYCLVNYPITRNSDNVLIKIWSKVFHGVNLDGIETLGSFESLTRARRFYQSQGKYKAEDEIIAGRAQNREEYRKNYSPKNVSGF